MFYNPIEYDSPVFRPPSEGRSLLIQVTLGCSNNKCTYCDMYRSKTYKVRNIDDIESDIRKSAEFYQKIGVRVNKVFLCDGDALGAPMEILERSVDCVNKHFPDIDRIGIYATAENILEKTEVELKLLAQKKLNIAYLGLESGDDKVLHMIVKGNTAQEMLESSLKIKSCGWKLSTIAMLGVGGVKYSEQHVENTAKMLGETSPDYFSFLTTKAVPGTPYHKMVERGLIEPLTSKALLQEMYTVLSKAEFSSNKVLFRANHVSNMHPIGGSLPQDTQAILGTIQSWINQTPDGQYPSFPEQM